MVISVLVFFWQRRIKEIPEIWVWLTWRTTTHEQEQSFPLKKEKRRAKDWEKEIKMLMWKGDNLDWEHLRRMSKMKSHFPISEWKVLTCNFPKKKRPLQLLIAYLVSQGADFKSKNTPCQGTKLNLQSRKEFLNSRELLAVFAQSWIDLLLLYLFFICFACCYRFNSWMIN